MKVVLTLTAVLALCPPGLTQSDPPANGDAESGDLTGRIDPLGNGFDVSATTTASDTFAFHGPRITNIMDARQRNEARHHSVPTVSESTLVLVTAVMLPNGLSSNTTTCC